jgi:hypothetical protein
MNVVKPYMFYEDNRITLNRNYQLPHEQTWATVGFMLTVDIELVIYLDSKLSSPKTAVAQLI